MIFIDTWVWLEFLGKTGNVRAEKIVEEPEKVISAAVIAELKYHCAKKFGPDKAESVIFSLENDKNLSIIPVTTEIAKSAADIRLKYYDKIKKPLSFVDCINLATAIYAGCEKFCSGGSDFEGIEEIIVEIIR